MLVKFKTKIHDKEVLCIEEFKSGFVQPVPDSDEFRLWINTSIVAPASCEQFYLEGALERIYQEYERGFRCADISDY